jgi:hypothetical protein
MILAFGSLAQAQTDTYSMASAVAGKPAQLNVHAAARNCQPAPLPTIKLIERPSNGTLVVRRATLTTNRIQTCPNLKVPAQVVIYTAQPGFTGKDRVVYEVESASGSKQKFDIEVTVTAAPQTPAKPTTAPI